MKDQKGILNSAVFFIVLLLMCPSFSNAQRLTGNIRGTIMDESGAPLPGVTVELSSPGLMGGIHTQASDEKGFYRFVNLPPGVYKIVFSLQGFQKIERINIKVSVRGTITEDIVMKPATLEESVTVTAKAPIVDVTNSGLSTNFDRDLLEKIPSGRFSFLDVVKQAPGIVTQSGYGGDSLMSAFGSNNESNAFQIDGLDITNPRMGDTYLFPNQDLFIEVEVSGIGAPAEYGSFSGAVVNIVTKSGGNAFSGSVNYYGQFKGTTGENNPDKYNPQTGEGFYSFERHKFLDAGFTLGGPVLKDKLWFFGSANVTRNDATNWKENPDFHSATKEDNYLLKLSSQITNMHKLVGVIAYRDWAYPEVPTPYLTKEATRLWRTKIPNWNVMYTWLISGSTFLELKTAGYRSKDDGLNQYGSTLDNSVHIDTLSGVYSNAPLWPYYAYYSRFQAHASISHFAEDFLAGDHEFKMGIQFNRGEQGSICGYSGGKLYYDYGGYNYLLYSQQPFYYGGQVNTIGLFFDDSWKLGSRLTINIGLRHDRYNGNIPAFDLWDGWHKVPGKKTTEVKDLITWNTFSPRIGFVLQLTSDKKTILKAHYGRYYDPLFVGTYEWPGPNSTDWAAYWWTGTGWEMYDFVQGSWGWSLAPNLKAPYGDQISIGVEREILPDFSMSLLGVYKNQKNPIALENQGGIYELVPMVSPDNNQTYMVYNQLNVGESKYVLTNPKDFGQKYKGIVLNLNKRFSNNWLFNSSLTWSRSEGLTTISPSTGTRQLGIISETSYHTGKDPNDWTNGRGLMQFDRTWVFKLQLGYTLPWDILASANFQYMTGRPYTSRVQVYPNQGRRRILAEPRDGKHRFDPLSMLDFRMQKTLPIYSTVRFSAILDIFNVFNSKTRLGYESFDQWSELYLSPSSIPMPRRLQVGLKLEF